MEKFNFKKKFGQNFLTDTNLLKAIVGDADVKGNENVLEIGAGAGTLTRELAKSTSGKVLSVEIDKTLQPILNENLKGLSNVEVVFDDILKVKPAELCAKFDNKPFKVVANLPYYISTPIIFYLIENDLPIESITIMLQKELADRIVAKVGTKDYGGISVILGLYGEIKKTRDVPRTLFTPRPNVDSSIITILINHNRRNDIKDISKVVKSCFAMRRKTLANNIMQAFKISREQANEILESIKIEPNARAETLDKDKFVLLTQKIRENKLI